VSGNAKSAVREVERLGLPVFSVISEDYDSLFDSCTSGRLLPQGREWQWKSRVSRAA
jgi:hypothetical protein